MTDVIVCPTCQKSDGVELYRRAYYAQNDTIEYFYICNACDGLVEFSVIVPAGNGEEGE
jgi:hypothetical protein